MMSSSSSPLFAIALICLILKYGCNCNEEMELYDSVEVVELVYEVNECKKSSDCPPFYYCYENGLMGWVCETHNVEDYDSIPCNGTDKSGNSYPNHAICRQVEMNITGAAETLTTARCYQSLNYTCSMSYFMPCTPNYDSQGSVIVGQEESCADSYSCISYKYGPTGNATTGNTTTTEVKVCASPGDQQQ